MQMDVNGRTVQVRITPQTAVKCVEFVVSVATAADDVVPP